jgi:hypothetical protein
MLHYKRHNHQSKCSEHESNKQCGECKPEAAALPGIMYVQLNLTGKMQGREYDFSRMQDITDGHIQILCCKFNFLILIFDIRQWKKR